jgi:hypothetical protein
MDFQINVQLVDLPARLGRLTPFLHRSIFAAVPVDELDAFNRLTDVGLRFLHGVALGSAPRQFWDLGPRSRRLRPSG